MSKPILFFGNEKFATGINTQAQIFRALVDSGYEIRALIVSQKLDKHTANLEVVKIAKNSNIEVKSYSKLKDSVGDIANFGVDSAILAAYGKIVPKEVLDIFKLGIINIHPSLLPRHRGPTPIESTILDGDTETGVSLIKLVPEMDAGPIYKQQSFKLSGNETKQELADKLDSLGKDLLLSNLEDILSGSLKPKEQPNDGATYDKLISKDDGIINWQEPWSAICRKIRAFSGWPKTRFSINGIDISLLEAHHLDQIGEIGQCIKIDGSIGVFNSDGLVVIDQLIPAGSKIMSGQDFLLGYEKQILT